MNNKSFKSNYNDYMKNIKPSQELINKTIQLAHKEQENLKHSKNKNFFRFLYNLDFKKYGALACTFIFAIFAVKLWSGLSQEEIQTEFPEDTTTTVTSSATDMTDFSDSSITTINTNNNIIDNSTIEYNTYTDSSQVIDTLTTSVPISQTSVDEFITVPNENTLSYISDTSENVIVTTVPNENSSINDTSENVIVTTVPIENVTSQEENSPIDTTTTITINSNTNATTNTTITTTTAISSNTNATTNTTITTTTAINSNTNITTTITNNGNGDVGASGGDVNVSGGDISVSEIIDVTGGDIIISGDCGIITNEGNITTTNIMGGDSCTEIEVPCTTTKNTTIEATIPENTTIEVTTTEPSMDAPDNSLNSLNKYVAFKLNLLEKYNGFYYNNSINMNKIKNYLSFGNDIVFVTPLNSNTISNGCECIMVIEVQSFNNTLLNSLMLELNNEYSYVENFYENNGSYEPSDPSGEISETTTPEFVEETTIEVTTSNINDVKVYAKPFQCYEDINGNGIPISEDLEDQQIILNDLNVQY